MTTEEEGVWAISENPSRLAHLPGEMAQEIDVKVRELWPKDFSSCVPLGKMTALSSDVINLVLKGRKPLQVGNTHQQVHTRPLSGLCFYSQAGPQAPRL